MAEADAEASFLRSMQAMNENSEIYTNGDASGQQIDSSSSDEYDPAPDVQNVTVPSGPQLQSQSAQDTSVDSSNNAFSRPLLASLQPSSNTIVQAVPETASPANDIPLVSNTNGNIGHPSRLQPNPEDPPSANVPSDPNAGNAESATTSDIVAAAREGSHVGQEVIVGDEAPAEATSTAAPPKARLPHDRIGILEDRIQEDERGDMDAWLGLIAEHRKRGKIEEARKTYEKFFTVFPDAVSPSYIRCRTTAN
jgi:cleavage stimulation factor subunit 3